MMLRLRGVGLPWARLGADVAGLLRYPVASLCPSCPSPAPPPARQDPRTDREQIIDSAR